MSFPLWALFLGVLLITMALTATLLPRLFMTSAMVYMAVGYGIGPGALGVIMLDPTRHADVLERVAEVALLVSLVTVGLKPPCSIATSPRLHWTRTSSTPA
jgi:uncharacterized membrane protein